MGPAGGPRLTPRSVPHAPPLRGVRPVPQAGSTAASRRCGFSSRRLDSRGPEPRRGSGRAGGVRLLDLGDVQTSGSPCSPAVGFRRGSADPRGVSSIDSSGGDEQRSLDGAQPPGRPWPLPSNGGFSRSALMILGLLLALASALATNVASSTEGRYLPRRRPSGKPSEDIALTLSVATMGPRRGGYGWGRPSRCRCGLEGGCEVRAIAAA